MTTRIRTTIFGPLRWQGALWASLAVTLLAGAAFAQGPRTSKLMSLARQSERSGNLETAERLYRAALAGNPDKQEAYHRLGVLAASRGDVDRAIDYFAAAERMGTSASQLLSDHGAALILRGDLAGAEPRLRAALLIDPDNKQARNNLELVLAKRHEATRVNRAAELRQLAEMRAAGQADATAKAIAEAKDAERVRRLAETHAAAQMRAAAEALATARMAEKAKRIADAHADNQSAATQQPDPAGEEAKGQHEAPGRVRDPAAQPDAASAPQNQVQQPGVTEQRGSARRTSYIVKQQEPGEADAPQGTEGEITAAPVELRGVTPGKTTREEVQRAWGKPGAIDKIDGAEQLTYAVAPYRQVLVRLYNDVVQSLTIQIDRPTTASQVEAAFQLRGIRWVGIGDEHDQPLGRAYPERGVKLIYQPDQQPPGISQVILEMIDAEAFVLRALSDFHGPYTANLADLNRAVELAPGYADAHWHKARLLLALGNAEEALESVEHVLEKEPRTVRYLLTEARCLADEGEFEEAIELLKSILAAQDVTPLETAEAEVLLANLLIQSPQRDCGEAFKRVMHATRLANPLTADAKRTTRRAAQEVLLEAYLTAPRCINLGQWQGKMNFLPMWIPRAEKLAQWMMEEEGGRRDLQLRVVEAALCIQVELEPNVSPENLVQSAEGLALDIWESTDDPLQKQQILWQIGLINAHAVKLACLRGEFDQGMQYAERADYYLQRVTSARTSSRRARYELGNAYYWIGKLYALRKSDPQTAADWFTRAMPLLAPEDDGRVFCASSVGNSLISMGISFWQANLKDQAVQTTERGMQLVKYAVEQGAPGSDSLAVAYGNLAEMYRQLGDAKQAAFYASLAQPTTK